MNMDSNGNVNIMEDVQLRPMNCELNPLSRSDGSVMLAHGDTCVFASVLGPIEVKTQHMKIDKVHVECVFRSKSGMPTLKEKYKEYVIRGTCEAALITALHPRSKISIQVQELDDRCGLEACAINAACLALLIGGAPMKFTFAAVHCIIDKDEELVLDPDHCQVIGRLASFIFVFDSLERKIVTVFTRGRFNKAQVNDAELLSRTASEHIFRFYRAALEKFHKNPCSDADAPANIKTDGHSETIEKENVPMDV